MKKFVITCLLFATAAITMSSCGSSEAKTMYQCPMKCEGAEVTYDKAGECPMCGMKLEEVK